MRWLSNKYENVGCVAYTLIILMGLALVFGVLCFEAWIVMLLWNAVIPLLWTSAPLLSFWVAMGLMVLCNILFGSINVRGSKN